MRPPYSSNLMAASRADTAGPGWRRCRSGDRRVGIPDGRRRVEAGTGRGRGCDPVVRGAARRQRWGDQRRGYDGRTRRGAGLGVQRVCCAAMPAARLVGIVDCCRTVPASSGISHVRTSVPQ